MLLVLWKKWFPPKRESESELDPSPESAVAAIQAGDDGLRGELIAKYKPYIAKTASRFSRRFIDPERDDEFSVALAAFDEAISRYSPDRGSRFLSFADKVITRRLIDYARQEGRHSVSVPYSAMEAGEDGEPDRISRIQAAEALAVYDREREAEERRAEIAALRELLDRFGIRFEDLTEQSPRHHDSRAALLQLGMQLSQTEELYARLLDKGQLPVKELTAAGGVSRKTVERHRKYLIAVALIARGAFPYLKMYIGLHRSGKEEA